MTNPTETRTDTRAAWILSKPIGEKQIMYFSTRSEAWAFSREFDEGYEGIETGYPSLGKDASGFYTVQYRRVF